MYYYTKILGPLSNACKISFPVQWICIFCVPQWVILYVPHFQDLKFKQLQEGSGQNEKADVHLLRRLFQGRGSRNSHYSPLIYSRDLLATPWKPPVRGVEWPGPPEPGRSAAGTHSSLDLKSLSPQGSQQRWLGTSVQQLAEGQGNSKNEALSYFSYIWLFPSRRWLNRKDLVILFLLRNL